MTRPLHHVALGARDVERVAEFYRELIGLVERARHSEASGALRSIWLDLGGALLMVERTTATRSRVEGIGAGPFLLAFSVAPAERRALCARLQAAGYPLEDESGFTSYFRDPEGNRVALSHYPEPAPES